MRSTSHLPAAMIIAASMTLRIPLAHADDCDAILDQGIRNTFTQLNTNDLKTAVSNSVCNSNSWGSSGATGAGGGVKFPINGIPIGVNANYKNDTAQSIKNDSCSNGSGNLSDQNYSSVLSMIADPNIVNAWSQCKATGLFLNGKINGDTVILEVKFRPVGPVTSATVNSTPTIFGARCDNPVINAGTKLTAASIIQACMRVGTQPITVVINTDWNAVMFYAPSPQTVTAGQPRGGQRQQVSSSSICFVPQSAFAQKGLPFSQTFCDQRTQSPPNGPVGQRCTCNLQAGSFSGCFATPGDMHPNCQ
jgi:hypothetical protein